jgi:catechol 2,3-dioxygenase-like lactoylglutathione lyase family enzyme
MKIGLLMLGVTDMARSVAFYRDAVGLPVQFGSGEFTFLDAGGVTLVLQAHETLPPPDDGLRTEVVFPVEDIDAAYRALRHRGVVFRIEPRIVTSDRLAADFRDPDGHVLSIFGPRRA